MPKKRSWTDIPITRKLWRALETGRLTRETFHRFLLEHHLAHCPTCAEEFEAHQGRADDSSTAVSAVGEQAVAAEAQEFIAELLGLPPEVRVERLRRAPAKRKTPALARGLLTESFRALPGNPTRALEFAILAEVAAEATTPRPQGEWVLAHAHQGNALRALGRLRDAGRRFALARTGLEEPDDDDRRIADLAVYATVDWMEGTYRREIARYEEAEELLNRAVLLFALEGDVATVHHVVLSLGALHFSRGNARDALDAVASVLSVLKEDENPRLYWLARFNHAVYLAEAELYAEAERELAACRRSSVLRAEPLLRRRGRWVEGMIAGGLGRRNEAERVLLGIREEYIGEEHGINAALVSLDLAKLYLTSGETAKLKQLAEELSALFSASDVHREALAALMLFQEAVNREALTAAYLLRLRRYLEAARHNPSLQFERPS